MIRGTTPDYILTLDGVDLSGQTVYVTLSQGRTQITKTGNDLSIATDETGSTIAFSLSQEDTLGLAVGNASIQVRFISENGVAQASMIETIGVDKVLLERVIEYADDSDQG